MMTTPSDAARHREVTDAVHQHVDANGDGPKIAMQILHSGRYGYHPFNVSASAKKAPTFGAETLTSAVNTVHRFLLGHVPRRPEAPAAPPGDVPAAAATGADDTPPPATPSQQQQQTARGLPVADVARLGGLAKSVLEHIQGKLAAAAAMAEKK